METSGWGHKTFFNVYVDVIRKPTLKNQRAVSSEKFGWTNDIRQATERNHGTQLNETMA